MVQSLVSQKKYESVDLTVQVVSNLSTREPVAVRPIVLASRLPMGSYDLALIDHGSGYKGEHGDLARERLIEIIAAIRSKLPNAQAYVKPSSQEGHRRN